MPAGQDDMAAIDGALALVPVKAAEDALRSDY